MIKKPANWIPFIKLKPERNAYQEKQWANLRQDYQMDLLLQQQANFFKINDPEVKSHLFFVLLSTMECKYWGDCFLLVTKKQIL